MAAASDKTRVLVIDDEPPIRRLLRTSLTAEVPARPASETHHDSRHLGYEVEFLLLGDKRE